MRTKHPAHDGAHVWGACVYMCAYVCGSSRQSAPPHLLEGWPVGGDLRPALADEARELVGAPGGQGRPQALGQHLHGHLSDRARVVR